MKINIKKTLDSADLTKGDTIACRGLQVVSVKTKFGKYGPFIAATCLAPNGKAVSITITGKDDARIFVGDTLNVDLTFNGLSDSGMIYGRKPRNVEKVLVEVFRRQA